MPPARAMAASPHAPFQRARQRRIGVAIEIEQPHHGVFARRRQPLRRPGHHRRRPAHHQRRHRADREGLAPLGIDAACRLERDERAVEPAGVGRAGLGEPAFEHVLAVEMRALAIGRRRRMHDRRLPGLVQAMQVRHRGIEREESIERQRRRLAVERQRLVAAQRDPVRIADRRHRREPVERAAQHDHQHARVAAFGTRELRQIAPRRTARRSASSNSRRDGA